MLMGIRLKAHPTPQQKKVLSQWMGCARVIWNAKCEEDHYLTTFARKYTPCGTYAPVDQTYSQYKDRELTPWLKDCPSQILRNATSNWYKTYQKFLKRDCGKPKRKKKSDGGSIHLTDELFKLEKCEDGVTRLFIGTVTNNIGYLCIKNHDSYGTPNSIYIKKINGSYTVSFCYEDKVDVSKLREQEEHLEYLRGADRAFLEQSTVGIDRGVVRPVQAGGAKFMILPSSRRKVSLPTNAISSDGNEGWLSSKRTGVGVKRQSTG